MDLCAAMGLSSELTASVQPRMKADDETLRVRIGSRLSDVERSVIEATLDRFAGNKRRAADVLGCSVKTLYNKLNRYARLAGET